MYVMSTHVLGRGGGDGGGGKLGSGERGEPQATYIPQRKLIAPNIITLTSSLASMFAMDLINTSAVAEASLLAATCSEVDSFCKG